MNSVNNGRSNDFALKLDIFASIEQDAKCVFYLLLSEVATEFLKSSEHYLTVKEHLELHWQWLSDRKSDADDLYCCVEDPDEETGTDNFLIEETDAQRAKVWEFISTALGKVSFSAFRLENAEYLPQSLEAFIYEEPEIFKHFFHTFVELHGNSAPADKLLDYLAEHYPVDGNNKIDTSEIRQYFEQKAMSSD